MSSPMLNEIKGKIIAQHGGDERQLEVVFSNISRLIVEAPAGYGKTTTMISRIAFLYASGEIPNPKRILGLTFSVNAALKVKREVSEKLPSLLGAANSPVAIGEKVTVTNYHGFCKGILKKYGYLLSDMLRKDINLFRAFDESDIVNHSSLNTLFSGDEIQNLIAIETAVKESRTPSKQAISEYNDIVIKKLLPLDCITHNAIILFVLELFQNHVNIKKFYQNYYSLIVVDEFQDTNCIAWVLLQAVISDHTQLLFLGDPLQRIYGFIGALQDIMPKAIDEYSLAKVALLKNYRFWNNAEMLKLDKNIRANAATFFAPTITNEDVAELPTFWGTTQEDEAAKIVVKVQALLSEENVKTAILFRGRSINAEIIENEFVKCNIPYFYGMFTDEDAEYVQFHNYCHDMFIRRFGKSKSINKKTLKAFVDSIKTAYSTIEGKTINSLLRLLDAVVEKVSIDYADLVPEDKYILLLDIFENRQLKQAMEYVDSRVIISTVHGAKGLEWDYVIVCDVEQWVFTFVCRDCPNKNAQNGRLNSDK